MIENLFIQFGALGIVAYVVYFQTSVLKEVIKNNTEAFYSVKENIDFCKKKGLIKF
jgi:hypothetical protein